MYKQKDNVIVGSLARVYKQKTKLPLDLLHVYKTENNFAGISCKRREDNVTLGSFGHVQNIRKVNFCWDLLHVYEGECEDSVTTNLRRRSVTYEGEDSVTTGSLGHVQNIRKVNFCWNLLHVYEREDSVTTGSVEHVQNRRKVDFCLDPLHVYETEDNVTTGSLVCVRDRRQRYHWIFCMWTR